MVLKALSKDPQERFVSVQSFAHALARTSRENVNELSSLSENTVPLAQDAHSSVNTIMNAPLSQQVVPHSTVEGNIKTRASCEDVPTPTLPRWLCLRRESP